MKKRIFKNTVKVILTITLTIAAYRYAQIERGYNAFGGETVVLDSAFFSTKNG